jgi:hypothetical protein
MDMIWKYITVNDPQATIYLHDCDVTEWERGDGYLALIFGGGFGVKDENEHNRTGRHLLTGRSAVVLCGGKLTRAEQPSGFKDVDGKRIELPSEPYNELDTFNKSFDIFGIEYSQLKREYMIIGRLLYDFSGHSSPILELHFECDEVLYCWNEYMGDAWFEDNHRYLAAVAVFEKLGFEKREIVLNNPYTKVIYNLQIRVEKIQVYKHPDSDIVYYFSRAETKSGFVIKSAPNLTVAADNRFAVAATFSDNIIAPDISVHIEYWLRREHFIVPTIIPGEWNAVETDADIERLQIYFGHFHDSYIVDLNYTTNTGSGRFGSDLNENYILIIHIRSTALKEEPIIEMRFAGLLRCSFNGGFGDFQDCYLKFHDELDNTGRRYIVWAEEIDFNPHNIYNNLLHSPLSTFAVAYGLKWRLVMTNEEV